MPNILNDNRVPRLISSTVNKEEEEEQEEEAAEEEEGEPLSFEDKMVGFISNAVGASSRNQKTLGLLLMSAAGLFLTLGNTLVQFIYKKSSKIISSYEILFVRSFIQAIFTLAFMIYGKVHLYGDKKKNIFALTAMGIAEVIAILFIYLALERIPVGDTTIIQFTAPVFTVLFSFIFLRRGCSLFDTICGAISFVGVVFIAKPDIILGHHFHPIHMHQHNLKVNETHNKMQIGSDSQKYIEGVAFALVAAMCLSLFFILNKLNGMKLDVTLTIMYPSVFGMIIAPIAMAIKKEAIVITELKGEYWGIIVAVGFVSFIGLMLMGEALQLEDAGPAVLIRNCDVIYAFILQYLLMHISPSLAALFGTLIVLGCSSLIALNRVFNLQHKCCGNKCDSICCEKKREEDDEEETHFMLRKGFDDEDENEYDKIGVQNNSD